MTLALVASNYRLDVFVRTMRCWDYNVSDFKYGASHTAQLHVESTSQTRTYKCMYKRCANPRSCCIAQNKTCERRHSLQRCAIQTCEIHATMFLLLFNHRINVSVCHNFAFVYNHYPIAYSFHLLHNVRREQYCFFFPYFFN